MDRSVNYQTKFFLLMVLLPAVGCGFFQTPMFHQAVLPGVPRRLQFVPDPQFAPPLFYGYHPTCWGRWPVNYAHHPHPMMGEHVLGEDAYESHLGPTMMDSALTADGVAPDQNTAPTVPEEVDAKEGAPADLDGAATPDRSEVNPGPLPPPVDGTSN